jgi:D-apiose dehydrogenase
VARRLRIALAGAGMVTRHHLVGWSRVRDADVVAICNRTQDRARNRAAEFEIPAVYGAFDEMLDVERPDAVDIAFAVDIHAEAVRAAAERGIAVFCQKPLTPTYAQARALVAEIGDRLPFMVHENWRFRPQYRQAAAWIAKGCVGAVRMFSINTFCSGLIRRSDSVPPPALERQPFFAELERFIVFELLIHHLDVARYLVGERLTVTGARLSRQSPDVVGEDTAHIVLEGDGGAVGTVVGSFMVPGTPPRAQDRMELVGEDGRILFEGNRLTLFHRQGDETIEFDLDAGYQASYDGAITHFAECLRFETPFETSAADNLETLRLVDETYRMADK